VFTKYVHLNFTSSSVSYSGSKLPSYKECGANYDEDRIIGGQNAPIDAFPWLALIEYRRDSGHGGDECKVFELSLSELQLS
jgi:hypothetical protein